MPKIYEVFGYPLSDSSDEANDYRKKARCPFFETDCDGGGNRYLSNIKLKNGTDLQQYFADKTDVHSGVCSLRPSEGGPPWIVCPRRLLVLGHKGTNTYKYQDYARNELLSHINAPSGAKFGVWPEVKLKYTTEEKVFDYTFDYILMLLEDVPIELIISKTGLTPQKVKNAIKKHKWSIEEIDNKIWVKDFPISPPFIIEIMTCSTSGGNSKKRTTIPMAFEDAILGKAHNAPTINKRQVWARMVSQLIVKSEVALAWGGKAFWVLQDVLVDYISRSTGLNIHDFHASNPSEVNIMSFGYGEDIPDDGVVELSKADLYSGPISGEEPQEDAGFQDMVRAPVCPPIGELMKLLLKRDGPEDVIQIA